MLFEKFGVCMPPTLSVSDLANRMPGVDQTLLNRRIRLWSQNGVLKPERRVGMKHRRYDINEQFMMAVANRLTDKGLNPLWLPHAMEILRKALAKQVHAESWEAAKRGAHRYLFLFAHPDPSDPEGMLLGIDLLEHMPTTKYPDAIFIDLTETFAGLRK